MKPGSPANVAIAVTKGAVAGAGGIFLLLLLGRWAVTAPSYQVIPAFTAFAATLAVLATGFAIVRLTNRDSGDYPARTGTPGRVTPAPPRPAAPPLRAEDGAPGHPAGGPPAAITAEDPGRLFSWKTGEWPVTMDGAL